MMDVTIRAIEIPAGVQLLIAFVALLLLVRATDESVCSGVLRCFGVWPRDWRGLLPNVWNSAVLHFTWGHLLDNAGPLCLLGAMIALGGAPTFLAASLLIIVLGGVGTWALARYGENHAGASGLVYGYLAYVLCSPDLSWLLRLGAIVSYILWEQALGRMQKDAPPVSHIGHLCGAVAGGLAVWSTPYLERHPTVERAVGLLTRPGPASVGAVIGLTLALFLGTLLCLLTSMAIGIQSAGPQPRRGGSVIPNLREVSRVLYFRGAPARSRVAEGRRYRL